jgi:hypothetical protein
MGDQDGYACELFMGPSLWREQPSPPYAGAPIPSMCVSVRRSFRAIGTQKSADPLWNNSKITYWGVTDLLDGKGSQRGYYNNIHADK